MLKPSVSNEFQVGHATRLIQAYQSLTGRHLIDPALSQVTAAKALFHAPFVVLSHDASPDPILSYGNLAALKLFALTWEELTQMPSRLTAEAPNRAERERLLEQVAVCGFIDNYAGIRIASTGQRFLINQATVWNLSGASGKRYGQAATFRHWQVIE